MTALESIMIDGGKPLYGEVRIQGSKNAALPVMAAAVLVSGESVLKGCPQIADVECMCRLLEGMGCRVVRKGSEIRINAQELGDTRLEETYVTRMRSSVMLMGPLLARCGEVTLHEPGGCVIGDRPIDIHLRALGELGMTCRGQGDSLYACAGKLLGCRIRLSFPSVGATENVIMAATAAEGMTVVENCAAEPEIYWLCEFLKKAGAEISMETGGLSRIRICGGKKLHPCEFEIPPDRIVAGTYMSACLGCGGEIFLKNAPAAENAAFEEVALRMGAGLEHSVEGCLVRMKHRAVSPGTVRTASYPGFPTDLQSPLLAVLAGADGESRVQETIFNGRFGVVRELNRMGAGISVQQNEAVIPGGRKLKGTAVAAGDLRGGAALVAAGLCAEGRTTVSGCGYIERGYEDICRDLRGLGADIIKIPTA